jgi:hypothetical protein
MLLMASMDVVDKAYRGAGLGVELSRVRARLSYELWRLCVANHGILISARAEDSVEGWML